MPLTKLQGAGAAGRGDTLAEVLLERWAIVFEFCREVRYEVRLSSHILSGKKLMQRSFTILSDSVSFLPETGTNDLIKRLSTRYTITRNHHGTPMDSYPLS